MPSMKRPAAAAAAKTPAAKRAGTAKDPHASKYQEIAEAVKAAEGFPQKQLNALAGLVKVSLEAAKDVRHRFAETELGLVEEVLKSTEAASREKVATLEAKVSESDAEKAARDAKAELTAEVVAQRTDAAGACEAQLAAAKEETGKANSALAAAQQAQKKAEEQYRAVLQRKIKLGSLRDGEFATAQSEPSVKGAKAFVKAAQGFGFDSNMLKAAESTLTKPAEEFGMFDNLVVKELEDAIGAAIKAALETLAQSTPDEHTAQVAAAQAAVDARSEEEQTPKAALEEAKKSLVEAAADRKAAVRAVKDFGPEMKQAAKDLAAAKKDLEGALAVLADFEGLRNRTTPPPPPAEEEAAAAEPAAAVEPATAAEPAVAEPAAEAEPPTAAA